MLVAFLTILQVQSYVLISETALEDGMLLEVAKQGDTTTVYAEHVTKGEQPNYVAAGAAEKVLWCYPNRWPHPDHLMPDVKGRILRVRVGDRIAFVPKSNKEDMPEKLQGRPVNPK